MNTNSWLADLGLIKVNIPTLTPTYKHSIKVEEDDKFITEKNFYAYSESFVNDIKNLLADHSLKPKQMYEVLLNQKKIPITRYGKIMALNTFQGYVLGIMAEIGQDARHYTRAAKIRKMIDQGEGDPFAIANKLGLEVGYVKATRMAYLRKLNPEAQPDKKTEIKSKVPEMIYLYVAKRKSTIEIAEQLNLSVNTINRNLTKNGVKMRSKKDYFNQEKVD